MKVTTNASRCLGSTLGYEDSVHDMLRRELEKWFDCIKELWIVAKIQPHVAYTVFVHRMLNKWSYSMQTTPSLMDLLQPLEDIIKEFILALTGKEGTDEIRELLALPTWPGKLRRYVSPILFGSQEINI